MSILILSGYCVVPGKRMYWKSSDDVRNDLIYNAMRRERFVQIMRFVHFSDNTRPDMNDKMWKMRPFMNLVKSNFLKVFIPTKEMDYDESMVAYFGRHGCKQFIRGKPIR
jgi:Transposase IS4